MTTNGTTAFTPTCRDTVAVSKSITVATATRIFVFGSGTFESNGAPSADGGAVRLELLAATGSIVGRTNFSSFRSTPPFGGTAIVAQGVLSSPTSLTTPVTVPAGTYTLRLMVSPDGNCTPPENAVTDGPTLTYLLLDA